MSQIAITARNISVTFVRRGPAQRLRRKSARREPERVEALRDVSFDVRVGEAFGIIGANGAGKSTLMRVLGRTLVPDGGDLAIRGATSTLLQLGVGFNTNLDGSRNIVLGCLAAGLTLQQVDEVHDSIWEYSELGTALYRPLSTYSRGMQSRLAFAIATFIDADILLVDEVLSVGDESFKQKSLATMHELLERSGTIVMVSHSLGTMQEFCDRVMWIDQGVVQQIGDPATVITAYRERYTRGDLRLVRATRSAVDQSARPLEVRRPEPLNPDDLRAARAGSESEAHHDLAPVTVPDRAPKRARRLISKGWQRGKGDIVSLDPPIGWTDAASARRFADLHSWEPIGTLLAANTKSPDDRWVKAAAAVASDWATAFPAPVQDDVWAPRTAGLRAHRLASLIDLLARDPVSSDKDLETLTASAQMHAWYLSDHDRFAADESTGALEDVYRLAGLIALARRVPELADAVGLAASAVDRLHAMLDERFAGDGVHLDHTPSYHAATVEMMTKMLDSGLVDDSRIKEGRDRAERALAWFVLPDGTFAGFGETSGGTASAWLAGAEKPSVGRIRQRWRTGPMRAAASAGKIGKTPEETVHVFRRGGYVVVRNHWPVEPGDATAAYLAMMVGRHSARRKHADDLSLVWFDRGRHLLVDAGRYEPTSDEPYRAYVTSARAHNTIEIDLADHFAGEAYGSGATHGGTIDGLLYAAGRAPFAGDLVLRRLAVTAPGRWLLLVDLAVDGSSRPHRFRQWFHPAADLPVEVAGDEVVASDGTTEMWACSLTAAGRLGPTRGEMDPEVQGWLSPSDGVIEPGWAFGWEVTDTPRTLFATVLSLAGPITEGSAAPGDSDTAAEVTFRIGDDQVTLSIDLGQEIPFHRLEGLPLPRT